LKRNGEYANEPWLAEPMNYSMKSIEVLPGQLWVLGDNRNASLDSHIWGGMPQQNLIGTAIWRYWPLARFGAIKAKAS
jgi:signal peptidase I